MLTGLDRRHGVEPLTLSLRHLSDSSISKRRQDRDNNEAARLAQSWLWLLPSRVSNTHNQPEAAPFATNSRLGPWQPFMAYTHTAPKDSFYSECEFRPELYQQ